MRWPRLLSLGTQVASVLAGSWRPEPPPPDFSPDSLAAVAPRLLWTGGAALAWWRVGHSRMADCPAAAELRQAYRVHSLQAAVHEEDLRQLILFLRAVGVEPILLKGWSIARHYPETGLRPYGDVDVYVGPEHQAAAAATLMADDAPTVGVDLHRELADLKERSFDELYGRSRLVTLGDLAIRVLGPEDQFRHICLHLLRHGAWRPLWLCDVGMLLESLAADFDWDYCLTGDRRHADWIACAAGLAHQLLGAHIHDSPLARRARRLPRWLVPAVLRQWGTAYTRYTDNALMTDAWRHPARLWNAIANRWPNPIEATVSMQANFSSVPRVLFQTGEFVLRAARWSQRLSPGT